MKKSLLIIVSIFFTVVLYAQTSTIQGTLKDKAGDPLEYIAIAIKGTKKATLTDSLGHFQFNNIAYGKYTLIVQYEAAPKEEVVTVNSATTTVAIALGEDKKELGEVVVVSSSRTNSRIEDLPTKVEVLGAEEVHEENQIKPGNIASLLGDIAGIQIQQTNAATGNADMRIQGLQGKYTQILRDGMPLFGGYSGSFGILQIPPLDLQQIELVKGSASTLYGGGAIAGMLNLVSKKPKLGKPEHSLTLNTSTLKENNLNLFFSGRNKKVGYTLFAGGTLQKQVDVNSDGFSDVPSTKNVFIHPRFFAYLNPKSTLILGYTLNYEDRNGGDMQVLNNQKDATHQFFIQNKSFRNTVDATLENKLNNNASLITKASINFFSRDISTNVFGMKANQTLWYSEIAYAQKIQQHNFVAGINFNGDDFKKHLPDSGLVPNESSNTIGFFVQDDWKLSSHFTVQGGLRVDVHNTYGSFVLPRLSMMYKANSKVTMRLGGGLGYKTPTLFTSEVDERDYRFLNGYRYNITAEKSYGANFDINYKTKTNGWDLTVNQTFFYNQIDKPISLYYQYGIVGPNPVFTQYYNEAKPLQTAGFETYVAAKHDALELYFGYVYTNAKRKYSATNENLPLIARNKMAAIVAYEFSDKFRVGLESSYTGKQYLEDGTQTQDYLFTALMMRYGFKKVSFVLNCENLFDYRQNKNNQVVFPPYTNPKFPEIWAPLDGRVINLSMMIKW
jgi:iron complex outermembrane receptor protein/outer membrane receptor for ferrienterochelin and colicins